LTLLLKHIQRVLSLPDADPHYRRYVGAGEKNLGRGQIHHLRAIRLCQFPETRFLTRWALCIISVTSLRIFSRRAGSLIVPSAPSLRLSRSISSTSPISANIDMSAPARV